MNNNAIQFDYQRYKYQMIFSPHTYFFKKPSEKSNSLRATFNNETVLKFEIVESNSKTDLVILFPEGFECTHFSKNKPSQSIISSPDTHLTYHGSSKKNKNSGEIHLKHNNQRILKDRQNLLEAPLATSSTLKSFPLPICRFELTRNIEPIKINNIVNNYFELNNNQGFFLNTIDIYIASSGFMKHCLIKGGTQNELLLSLLVNSSVRTFSIGELGWEGAPVSRAAHFIQLLVLPCKRNELIILNTLEQQNKVYKKNSLHYFHTKDYFETFTNRNVLINKEGKVFLDLKTANPKKWEILKDQIK
jgi:hypothetical protein